MVRGLDTFREYFRGFENQYVLIGGAACDILFANNEGQFRATRDLDEIIERFVSRIKVIGYDKYKWIINLSGKEFDESKDMDSEIQITRVLSF